MNDMFRKFFERGGGSGQKKEADLLKKKRDRAVIVETKDNPWAEGSKESAGKEDGAAQSEGVKKERKLYDPKEAFLERVGADGDVVEQGLKAVRQMLDKPEANLEEVFDLLRAGQQSRYKQGEQRTLVQNMLVDWVDRSISVGREPGISDDDFQGQVMAKRAEYKRSIGKLLDAAGLAQKKREN